MPNGQPAVIQITMTPDGNVTVQFKGMGRVQFNAMMTTAMQDMHEKFREMERGPKVEVAPPGLRIG